MSTVESAAEEVDVVYLTEDDHDADHHLAAHGEHLRVDERLVLSPLSGRFWVGEESVTERGEFVVCGQVVGHVVAPDGNPVAVRTPFSGWAMGFLIPNGSPVKTAEPVLWLRAL
jgi:biotin carboxyl carrier protein